MAKTATRDTYITDLLGVRRAVAAGDQLERGWTAEDPTAFAGTADDIPASSALMSGKLTYDPDTGTVNVEAEHFAVDGEDITALMGPGGSFAHLAEVGPSVVVDSAIIVSVDGITRADAWVQIDQNTVGVTGHEADSECFYTYVAHDDAERLIINADGSLHWGDGTAPPDISMLRSEGRLAIGVPGFDPDTDFSLLIYPDQGVLQVGNGTEIAGLAATGARVFMSSVNPGAVTLAHVDDGIVHVSGSGGGGGGIQMKSPDGTAYNVTVTDGGAIDVAAA